MKELVFFAIISIYISSCDGLFESPTVIDQRLATPKDMLTSHLYIDHAPILTGADSVKITKQTFGTFAYSGIRFIPNLLEIDSQKVSVAKAYSNPSKPYVFHHESDTVVALIPFQSGRTTEPFYTNISIQGAPGSGIDEKIIPLNMGGYIIDLPPLDTMRYEEQKVFNFPTFFSHSLYIRPFATIDSNNNINKLPNITSSDSFGFDNSLDLSSLPYQLEEDVIFQLYIQESRSSGDIHSKNVQQNGKVFTIYYLHIKV